MDFTQLDHYLNAAIDYLSGLIRLRKEGGAADDAGTRLIVNALTDTIAAKKLWASDIKSAYSAQVDKDYSDVLAQAADSIKPE